MTQSKPTKNWEELVNDGANYGDTQGNYSPIEKIIFESIKDKILLKIQDSYAFLKKGPTTILILSEKKANTATSR